MELKRNLNNDEIIKQEIVNKPGCCGPAFNELDIEKPTTFEKKINLRYLL